MGVEGNLKHLSSDATVYVLQVNLRPLLFWPRFLQIDLLLILVVFLVLIVLIVAKVLDSGAFEILHRLREDFIGNSNTQLQAVPLNLKRTAYHCGETRLTSM
jgi:hypothetical protein